MDGTDSLRQPRRGPLLHSGQVVQRHGASAWIPATLLLLWLTAAAATLVTALTRAALPSGAALGAACAVALAAVGGGALRVGERSLLGLAALFFPSAGVLVGPAWTGLLAGCVVYASQQVLTAIEGQHPDAPPERRLRARRLRDALGAAGMVLVAGWLAAPGGALRMAFSTLALVLLSQAHQWASQWSAERVDRGGQVARGALWDGLWWLLGGLPALAIGSRGMSDLGGVAGWLAVATVVGWLAFALALERSRTAYLSQRLGMLDVIGSAPRRLATPGRRQPDVVHAAVDEIARAIDFDYLQIDLSEDLGLVGRGDALGSWFARRHHPPVAGVARPPAYPAPRPGIHKRRGWIYVDRPLESASGPLGRLQLWCDPRRHDHQQLELLGPLLEQLVVLLERAKLAREARFDRLTGLPRRGIFDDELVRRFEASRVAGGRLGVVLLDVDHFKKVNDNHGHPVGDSALVHVANLLAQAVRAEDLCCRYGGEEFVLLLDQADGESALELAERARQLVEQAPLEAGSLVLPLTLSAGVASMPELLVHEAVDLVQLADEALYCAKESGRNRCLLALGRDRYRSANGQLVERVVDPSASSDVSAEEPTAPAEQVPLL